MNIHELADRIEEYGINHITFPRRDIIALYNLISSNLSYGMRVLEIGSWKGASSIVIAKTIQKCNGTLVCLDTWKGTYGDDYLQNEASKNDVFSIFSDNLNIFNIDNVIPIIEQSSYIRKMVGLVKFDLIFIDGDHRYDPFINDISNSLRLIRNGGVISGHDCVKKFTDYDDEEQEEIIREKDNPNWIPSKSGVEKCCGVIGALYLVFNDEYYLHENSLIWSKNV